MVNLNFIVSAVKNENGPPPIYFVIDATHQNSVINGLSKSLNVIGLS